jgi:hypothetical protein
MSGKPKKAPLTAGDSQVLLAGRKFIRRNLLIFSVVAAVLGALVIIKTFAASPETANLWIGSAGSCTRSATKIDYSTALANGWTCSTFGAAYSSASNSTPDTVMIMAGSYAAFSPTTKSVRVTFKAAAGQSVALAQSSFGSGSKNVTLDGLTIHGIDGGAQVQNGFIKDLTIQNSTIDGQVMIRTNDGSNLNILIDHNKFMPWDRDFNGSPAEGRLSIAWPGGPNNQPDSGVTVSNNEFVGPGCSDGMQLGAAAVQVIGNTLHGITQNSQGVDCANTSSGAHVDAIQIYGAERTLFKDNVLYGNTTGIINYNGGAGDIAINNAIRSTERDDEALGLGGETSPVIKHNYVEGWINVMGSTSSVVQDNVAGSIWIKCPPQSDFGNNCGPVGTLAVNDYNLITDTSYDNSPSGAYYNRVAQLGPHSIHGSPTLTSAAFTDLIGAQLKSTSLGYNSASDGTSIGVGPTGSGGSGTPSDSTPGDVNGDKRVGILDLSLILSNFGKTTATWTEPRCDTNGDGKVTIVDLSVVLSKYGTTYP